MTGHMRSCQCVRHQQDHLPRVRQTRGCTCHRLRLPRRIHAASGALFGLFLAAHLFVNSTTFSPAIFNHAIRLIRNLHDAIAILPWGLVYLPLCVQVISGLYLLQASGLKYNTRGCNRGSTPRFFLQRISGLVLLFFIAAHLGTLHGWGFHAIPHTSQIPLTEYQTRRIFPAAGITGAILFLLGGLFAVYHFGNGAISGAHVWGMFQTTPAVRRWRRACLLITLILMLCALIA